MRTVLVMTAALGLAACGGGAETANGSAGAGTTTASTTPAAPVKQQPGSWTNKIQIVKLDAGPGVDNDKIKQGMQSMFDAVAGRGVCITPAMVQNNSVEKNIEQLAAQGKKCDFSRKIMDGEKVDFAGTCTDANGTKVQLAINGRNTATAQDMTVTSSPIDASGTARGSMELKLEARRTGECKPGDITPPAPGAVS